MAVWQTTLVVSPDHPIPKGWESWPRFAELEARLTAVLEPGESWHPSLKRWGEGGHHEIDLWLLESEEEKEGLFCIRVDLRDDYFDFVNSISTILVDFNLKILRDNFFEEATFDTIMSVIIRSNAYRFVADPHHFLQELSRRNNEL
ncbi:MAG: hypothetical protein OHK0029_22230 [Armatimonadaceae bacterium]